MSPISVTKHDYDYLKNNILLEKKYNSTDTEKHLAVLKHKYENQIKSKRRLDDINSIDQLLTVLEKRDLVSENDITILEDIATQTRNHHFFAEIDIIRANLVDTGRRNIFPTPTMIVPDQEFQYIPAVTNRAPTTDTHDVKRRVLQTIATTIGNKWIDFARALNMMESKIDNLKIIYSNNSEQCTKEVLEFHERNVHPRDWKTKLLNALEKARRNDIKNEVNRIYDAYSAYY